MTKPGSHSGGELPATVVACVTVIIVAIIGAVTVLILKGKELSGFLVIISTLILPAITTLLAVRNGLRTSDVAKKVDGKIDNLITDKSNLEQQIAMHGILPVTAKLSYDPDSTGPMQRIPTDTNPMMPRHAAPPTGEVKTDGR